MLPRYCQKILHVLRNIVTFYDVFGQANVLHFHIFCTHSGHLYFSLMHLWVLGLWSIDMPS